MSWESWSWTMPRTKERSILRAEVVHVKADTEFLESAHGFLGGGGVGDESAFGDFEAKAGGGEAGFGEDLADAVDNIGLLELFGGEVNADAGGF
jgi:hypothetical protein